MEQITRMIRERRIELNLSQEELGLLSNSQRTYITKLEGGKFKHMSTKKLFSILKVLNIEITYIHK